jgi:hypothetical protein
MARALRGGGRPFPAGRRQHHGDLLVRSQRDPVHAVAGGECEAVPAAQPVPERRMRALVRLHHHRNVGEFETPAVIVDAIAREALVQNVEDVLEILARPAEINTIGFELHGRSQRSRPPATG